MNTTDNQQRNDTAWPDPTRLVPEESRERSESVEATSTPEAVRAAQVARDDKQHAIVRGRGVEWVRPTDLIARHSAHAAGRGLDFQAELARRTRTPHRRRRSSSRGPRPAAAADLGVRAQHRTCVAGVPLRGLDELTVVTGHGRDGIGMQDALVGASAHLPARRCRHHDHINQHQHRAGDGLRG